MTIWIYDFIHRVVFGFYGLLRLMPQRGHAAFASLRPKVNIANGVYLILCLKDRI